MRLTYRTLLILLFITALIMAYCSTTAEAGIIKHRHRSHHRPTKTKYKMKTKTKTKTKIKISNKKPGLFKKIG